MTRKAKGAKKPQFIFAKLKTSFRNHDKLLQAIAIAGWGVLGVYAWATMDLREKESKDGVISDAVIRVGMPNQPDTQTLVQALVDVGLFVRREGGYYVDKYELHNDTKDVIEKNREKARNHMRDVRANKHLTTAEQSSNDDQTNRVREGDVAISISPSSSDLGSGVFAVAAERADTRTAFDDAMPLPDEWRANAAMLGVRDIDEAYAKFKALLRSKPRLSSDWKSEWELFFRREKTFQARDRDSGSQRFDGPVPDVQHAGGRRTWNVGGDVPGVDTPKAQGGAR